MRYSKLFSKTTKQTPKDEVSKNAQLLIQAGFIYKEMSGVYDYLPLGLRVLNKISNIIREEMNVIGGEELLLSALQESSLWERTDRWSDKVVDNWFKTKLKNDSELGLGFTHEEPLTNLMRNYIRSYRDLPVYVYQIQTKFRNETRAKSGLMRGREFSMKDLYSFSKDEQSHNDFYEQAKQAYLKVFDRLGIGDITYLTFASGGTFSKYSHEFQTLTEAGEDVIYVDEQKKIAVNKEVYNDEVLADLDLKKEDLIERPAVEVGNIFGLGTKFSEAFELNYVDENGESKLVVMGSYGIGPGRLMGTIAEVLSDDKGIIWPESVSPFKVHLIGLDLDDEEVKAKAEKVYEELKRKEIEVLFDDREDVSAGIKFADCDLIGIPYRIVVSKRTGDQVEVKKRTEQEADIVDLERITDGLQ